MAFGARELTSLRYQVFTIDFCAGLVNARTRHYTEVSRQEAKSLALVRRAPSPRSKTRGPDVNSQIGLHHDSFLYDFALRSDPCLVR